MANAVVRNNLVYEITVNGKERLVGTLKEVMNGQKKVKTATDQATASATRQTAAQKKQKSAMAGIVRNIKSMVAAYISFRAVVGIVRGVINVTLEQEKAVNDLNASLRNTGVYSSEFAAALQANASALQRQTIYGDEAILSATALMQNVGKLGQETLPAAQKAAIGLATAFRMDLQTAFMLMGRAAAGDTALLTRYGIKLDTTASKQEQFNQLLEIGAGNFALAQAETDTAAGSIEQMKNAVGDAGEALGKVFKPAIEAVTMVIGDFADMLVKTKTATDKATEEAAKQRVEFERLVITYTRLREKTELTKDEHELYKKTISDLHNNYANYWSKDLNFEKSSWETISSEIEDARKQLNEWLKVKVKQAALAELEQNLATGALSLVQAQLRIDEIRAQQKAGVITTEEAEFKIGNLEFGISLGEKGYAYYVAQYEKAVAILNELLDIQPPKAKKKGKDVGMAYGEGVAEGITKSTYGMQVQIDKAEPFVSELLNKWIDDWTTYYDTVKYEDEEYYGWKVAQIKYEVEQMEIATAEKARLIDFMIAKLNEEQAAYLKRNAAASAYSQFLEDNEDMRDAIIDLTNIVTHNFRKMITEGESLSEVMKNIFLNIADYAIQQIQRIIAEWVAMQLMMLAFNIGTGNVAGAVGFTPSNSSAPWQAPGGYGGVGWNSIKHSGDRNGVMPLPTPGASQYSILNELRMLRQAVISSTPQRVKMDFNRGELSYAVANDGKYRTTI